MVDDERTKAGQNDNEPPFLEAEQGLELSDLRDYVPADIRDVSFPSGVRGYDRRAVDAYVQKVNTVIAELEVSRSPQAAVRHALDRVGRQTSGILQRARESADEISASAWSEADRTTARANEKAEEITARANAEAEATVERANAEAEATVERANAEAEETTAGAKAESDELLSRSRTEAAERLQRLEQEIATLREQAETRLRELDADTEVVWGERAELVGEVRELGARLEALGSEAAARFPRREPPESQETGTPSEAKAAPIPGEPDTTSSNEPN